MNQHHDLVIQVKGALRSLGLDKIYVFGSVARGDDTNTSDIDMLVDLSKTSLTTDRVRSVLEEATQKQIDLISLESLNNPMNRANNPYFTQNVLKDLKVIHA
jgi:predicted nucleotidyltransferase